MMDNNNGIDDGADDKTDKIDDRAGLTIDDGAGLTIDDGEDNKTIIPEIEDLSELSDVSDQQILIILFEVPLSYL